MLGRKQRLRRCGEDIDEGFIKWTFFWCIGTTIHIKKVLKRAVNVVFMRVFSCDEVDIMSLRHVINEVEDLQYNQRNKNKKTENN